RPATSSLRALTRFMSTRTSPLKTRPYSAPRRATWAAYALAMSVFVGVHPVFTQVPPNLWRSMMATDMPAATNRAAKDGPAWPVPIMIASKCRDTTHLLLIRRTPLRRRSHYFWVCAPILCSPGRTAAGYGDAALAQVGNSAPACSAAMYAAYQSG